MGRRRRPSGTCVRAPYSADKARLYGGRSARLSRRCHRLVIFLRRHKFQRNSRYSQRMTTPLPACNDERLLETHLEIAGVCCEVTTNSSLLLSTLGKWHSGPPPQAGDKLRISVVVRDELDHPPLQNSHFRGLGHVVFASWGDACFVVFDILRRQTTAVVSRQCAADAAFWNTLLL